MIEELRKKNEELLKKYSGKLEYAKEHAKQMIIQEMLRTENCFKELEIEVAYAVLKDLQIKEEMLDSVYLKLIKE